MPTSTLPSVRPATFDPTTWTCPHSGCGTVIDGEPIAALISEHLDGHRKVEAATRAAALRSVATLAAALREVIAGDERQAASLLSELTPEEITAVLEPLTRTLGLLVGVESMRKAAKR